MGISGDLKYSSSDDKCASIQDLHHTHFNINIEDDMMKKTRKLQRKLTYLLAIEVTCATILGARRRKKNYKRNQLIRDLSILIQDDEGADRHHLGNLLDAGAGAVQYISHSILES
jgi:hypothetical protein